MVRSGVAGTSPFQMLKPPPVGAELAYWISDPKSCPKSGTAPEGAVRMVIILPLGMSQRRWELEDDVLGSGRRKRNVDGE